MKGISKNIRLAKRTGGRCKPVQLYFESALDAGCENSTGGTDITFKLGVIITSSRVATREITSRPLMGEGFFILSLNFI
jgi:hypothetical protein